MSQGAQDAKSTTIDGHTYRCLMLDPLVATDMVADLGHLLGPSLGALGGALLGDRSSGSKIEELMEKGGEAFGAGLERAVTEFFARFDKAKQREFIGQLAEVTYLVSGEKEVKLNGVLAVHFRGRIGALYKWMGWALKVQFEDFFSPFGTVISRVVQRAGPE